MNHLLSILITAILCATASAQTIKTLGYNTTNGRIVYSGTNTLTFSNVTSYGGDFTIGANGEFSYGGTLIFEPETQTWFMPFGFSDPEYASITLTNLGLGANGTLQINTLSASQEVVAISGTNWVRINTGSLNFSGPNQAATTRTNLGLPLAALTNTSNVTMMRALAGSTNTSEPYSGSISVVGTNNTNTLVFSNGILQSAQ